MFNQFYSLSSIRSSRFSAICFALVLLLLAQPVAACGVPSNVQIKCENGYQTNEFLIGADELSNLVLPQGCEATPQTVQDFETALSNVVALVAEKQTQWINIKIIIGDSVVVPVYDLGDCVLRETQKVGDVVVVYEHARSYCVLKRGYCYEYWSLSYIRKTLADAEAGIIGNLVMSIGVALVGMVFGAKAGEKDYRLGRFFPKKLAYGLFGFLGLYALVMWLAYTNSWIAIFELGFLGPVLILRYGGTPLLHISSFGEFFLMIAGFMFVLVFVAMQIKLSFKREKTQKSV